jgi:PAS domain S-box-containing protein
VTILLCGVPDQLRVATMETRSADEVISATPELSEALRLVAVACPTVIVVGGATTRLVSDSCRQLRAIDVSRRAVIVALGGDRPDDVRALIESGADDFCAGTLDGQQLRGRLLVAQRRAADVARHRTTEKALRESSESLATTLNSIGDGVIATDPHGLIVRMNPIAEKITGWAVDEAKGCSLAAVLSLVNSDTRVAVENPFDHALREGVSVALAPHTLLIRRDGAEIPIADSCAPIRSNDGTVAGAVLVFRDLTAQQAAEASQARLRQQLVFADRMASVGTLAAGVAHEINNPLSYVAANVDLAIEELIIITGGSTSGRLRELEEMLIEARSGISRVSKIVRALKTFSRIEEERSDVIDLIPVIELSINMSYNELRHCARIVKDYGAVPLVEADDARLGQVFINLLVNAAQAFPHGDTQANEIRIVTSTDADGRALVEVRDNGPGIAPEILPCIFDPFFTTKALGAGTGLGLAISHNIVTGMGGTIVVQSEINRGTSFRVTLPASRSPVVTPRTSDVQPKATAERPAIVLVVDDEPSIGSAIRRVLRRHDVTVVTTAQDALDILATGKEFDLVLSDLMMPGMSGMEMYRTLLKLSPKTAARLVFLTGGAFTPEAQVFLDGISNERLEKPFVASKLREMVENLVRS